MRYILIFCFWIGSLGAWGADDLAYVSKENGNHVARLPGPDDRTIARYVATLLVKAHFLQHPLNAEFSSKFLDTYLDALDPMHMLFVQADLEDFSRFRNTLGDLTMRLGDTMPSEIIYARFLERCDQQHSFVTNLLATEKFTFTGDDRFVFNRKDVARPKDLDEARKLWRDRLRFEYLQEKLNKKKPKEIVELINRRYARQLRAFLELDTDEVLQIYLSALAHVYDPHSDYLNKAAMDNFNINMKLSLFGIGALLQSEDGYCKIMSLTPGSPAEKSKRIKPHDRIVAVAQGTNDFVDVVDMKLSKVVELIRGPKGTEVRLLIIPADTDSSTRKTVALVRDEIPIQDSEAKAKIVDVPAQNDKGYRRLGVLDLPSFYADMGNRAEDHKSTTTDILKLLKKLNEEKVEGIILDLRRNGGGSLEEAIKLTGLFIKDGPVVQVRDYDGTITEDKDVDTNVQYDGPLIVLTSRFSASASEILAGALQDYGRALIVGDSSTHGKGTVQTVQDLNHFTRTTNNLGSLKFTIRKFYRPSGSSTQLKGVTPDIILPSVNNYADLGEASLPNALGWDTIRSAKFEPVNEIAPLLEELRKHSEQRLATNADFTWMNEEIERFKKHKEDKSISLNEKARLKEKKEAEDRSNARKKELKARGESKEKVYEITLKLAEQPGLPPAVTKTNDVASVSQEGKTNAVASVKKETAKKEKTDTSDAPPAVEGEDEEVKDDTNVSVDMNLDEAKRILLDMADLARKKGGVATKP